MSTTSRDTLVLGLVGLTSGLAAAVTLVILLAARGLTLTGVEYPADDLLAARAEQTRARRS